MFVTVWLGILDIHSGHMVYVNAGHNPPLIGRSQLTESGCPDSVRIQIEMAVEEIFVNIVTYAYAPEHGEVEITYSLTDAPIQITIEFQDQGRPFDPLKQPNVDLHGSAEEREIRGLGIVKID